MALAAPLAAVLLAAAPPDPMPLREADLALDRAAAAHDRAAFAALLTPDTYWSGGGAPLVGPAAVLADWSALFEDGGPSLRWAPTRAEVAASGDLGFTTGSWTLTAKDPQGEPIQRTGQYATVWTRGADGRWRVLIDTSLRPAQPSAAELVRAPERRAAAAAGDLRVEAGRYRRGEESGVYLTVTRPAGAEAEVLIETLVPARAAK